MNPIFTLQHKDEKLVVLKVHADDTLTIAMNPFLNGNMDYISVTRGETQILTVINKDGSTWTFNWGVHGHTLIDESVVKLKEAVLHFIYESCIFLKWDETIAIKSVEVFFNHNRDKFELLVNHEHNFSCMFFDNVSSLEEARNEASKYLPFVVEWTHKNGDIESYKGTPVAIG